MTCFQKYSHVLQASRTHYCCHPTVSKKKNVDEECDRLMEDSACKYFTNVQKLFGMQDHTKLQVLPAANQLCF